MYDHLIANLPSAIDCLNGVNLISALLTSISLAILLLGSYFYHRNLRKFTFSLDQWGSVEIEKGIRCNQAVKNGNFVESLDHKTKGKGLVKTVYDCFLHGIDASDDGPCLGRLMDNFSRYEWVKYSDVRRQAELIGKMLRGKGICRQTCIGIYGANSPEWVISEISCVLQSLISVPLYETLGLEAISHTINEVEMPVIFCDSAAKLDQILADRTLFPALKIFVLLNDNVDSLRFSQRCAEEGIEFFTWTEAQQIGLNYDDILANDPPRPDDIFLIQYTSGTTGMSKGAVITHRNVVAAIAGAAGCGRLIAPSLLEVTPNDKILLYMPLPHAYAQNTTVWFLYAGGKIAFASGNVSRIISDIQVCKPTYFPLVPRIMNRLYAKVVDETRTGLKGWLFWNCYERKRALFRSGCWTRDSIYDWIVFRKLQNLLGGNVRAMTTGSAPVAPEVLEFWRVVFGTVILEAFGSTETTAFASAAVDPEGGNVGHPLLSCAIRLMSVPELGYFTTDDPPRGEILVKGTNVIQGYYKRPDLTKETFTADNWLLTGDIGEFLPDGSLRIIDRRKHIFKLSQGEYVAPEKVESTYSQCPLVAQVFVDGNGNQDYTVAVVVPDDTEAIKWALQHHGSQFIKQSTLPDLCSNRNFQRYVLETLTAIGKLKGLNSLEQIKSLYLHCEPFTVDNGLLTPTMKNKRNNLRRRFQAEVDALYKAGPFFQSDGRETAEFQRAISA